MTKNTASRNVNQLNYQIPALLAIETCTKLLNKEVSRRMSHTNHRITYNQTSICLEEVTMRVGHEVLVATGDNGAQLVISW